MRRSNISENLEKMKSVMSEDDPHFGLLNESHVGLNPLRRSRIANEVPRRIVKVSFG